MIKIKIKNKNEDKNSPGLLENGIQWEIILCNAVRYASAEVVYYLIHIVGIEAWNATFEGKNVIHLAVENRDRRVMRDLLNLPTSKRPDLNALCDTPENYRGTALHLAARYRDKIDAYRLLIEYGIDETIHDSDGNLACEINAYDIKKQSLG
ncbi:MAG: ankyrin repeat domain-containing protein [Planctomycetia bacterium]|nr:ankyrin repeat domain-containing protein [Planctomycetia bacterium]